MRELCPVHAAILARSNLLDIFLRLRQKESTGEENESDCHQH
jgi:hypothetical protein